MSEQLQDFELLNLFVRQSDQSAFAAIARRHVDLVYATALRKVDDNGAAEEVAQNVFAALARKAWQFGPEDSLPAWLYRATLLESNGRLRGEIRRRRRELAAAELGTTMNASDEQPSVNGLVPLLDDALEVLPERSRTALLLRYYEGRSLREVGASLGIGEDAARKVVTGALERLAQFFRRRGFKTATVAVTCAALAHTATSTPALVLASILQETSTLGPVTLTGLKTLLSRFTGLTKVQSSVLCLLIATVPTGWRYEQLRTAQHQATVAQTRLEAANAEQEALTMEVERLRTESERFTLIVRKSEVAQAEEQKGLREMEGFKTKVLGLLTATNYHWPDDLPFVRIPKSTIAQIQPGKGIRAQGKIDDWAAELLAINPDERQKAEQSLAELSRNMAQLAASQAYETNYVPRRLQYSEWSGYRFETVAVPPLGTPAQLLVSQTTAQLEQRLGQQRAQLLFDSDSRKNTLADWDPWIGACLELSSAPQMFTALVNPGRSDSVGVGVFRTGPSGCNGLTGAAEGKAGVTLWSVPGQLSSAFFDPWLNHLGLTNTVTQAAQ